MSPVLITGATNPTTFGLIGYIIIEQYTYSHAKIGRFDMRAITILCEYPTLHFI